MSSVAEELVQKTCAQGKDGVESLTDTQVERLLKGLAGWQRNGEKIIKEYTFKDHYKTQAFTNAVMWVSHREDHHPSLTVGYNTCQVDYWTHTLGGLSENDFICAAKVDNLFER